MNLRIVLRILGFLTIMISSTMVFPIFCSLYYREPVAISALVKSMVIGLVFGGVLILIGKKNPGGFYRKEGLATVGLAWVVAGLVGALPYYLSSTIPDLTGAIFESVSGFTTTGSTVIKDIESLAKGILFWRAFTQWVGGMGIILLFIAVFPVLGIGSKQMYKMEMPGIHSDKSLVPEIKYTALILWSIYALLTIAEILLLKYGGMTTFDSFCHTFTTLATGGFSTKNASIAHYNSVYLETVITMFMLLAGTNFALYFSAVKGNLRSVFKDTEFKVYIAIVAAATVLVGLDLFFSNTFAGAKDIIRYSLFQVVSMQTTTGFTSTDFNAWPYFSKILLVLLMVIGACTGSTGGGTKVMRVIILVKSAYIEILKFIRPNVVKTLKVGQTVIEDATRDAVLGFFIVFSISFVGATFIMTVLGLDIVSAFSSVAATTWNVGPGLEKVGAIENYAFIHPLGKITLSFCMIMGRLEIFTFLALFIPEFWRK